MESNQRRRDGASTPPFRARLAHILANAKLEGALLLLLLATIAAVVWQDAILTRTFRLTPASIASLSRMPHTDRTNGGTSTASETSPFRWSCQLWLRFEYPYCGYELFLGPNRSRTGLDLTNLKSLQVTMLYRGPSKSFRVYLKNFDRRYAENVVDDSPKFNRVEFETTPGRLQTVTFDRADFGVADWWLFKHKLPPKLSHPQFDNITSLDVQTGTDNALGRHDFEVRAIVIRKAILSDAQYYLSLLGAWVVLLGAYLAWRIGTMRGELERRAELQEIALRQAIESAEAARRDPLTQAYNRRGVAERYGQLCAEPGPLAVAAILIDLDGFKALNDRYGHRRGDDVLIGVSALIRRNIRAGDTLGRWGGEEFLLLCPGIDANGAMIVAEKLRRKIEAAGFGDCGTVTASFGVHWAPATGPELTELVALADIALYSAKHGGRNCARIYRPGMAKAA